MRRPSSGHVPPIPSSQHALTDPLPVALLDDPLDYIFAVHFRHRCICAALRRVAEARQVARAEADSLIAYLDEDLRLHHQDEDEILFPAVRRRALAADALGAVFARLVEDHRRMQPMIDTIIDALSSHTADDPVTLRKPACEAMRAYATLENRHLSIENGIVLSIARVRLTKADLSAISQAMKSRRGMLQA